MTVSPRRPPPRPDGTSAGPRGQGSAQVTAVVEVAVLAVVVALAWRLATGTLGAGLPAVRIAAVLELVGGSVAGLMIAVAGRASGSRRAVRIAGAAAGSVLVGPLPVALGIDRAGGLWPLVGALGTVGTVALLALAVRRRSAARNPVVTAAAVVLACSAAAAGLLHGLAPGVAVPGEALATAGLVAWAGAGAAGLLTVVAGYRRDRPLLRRTGLAFVLLGVAHAARTSGAGVAPLALEIAATVALLAAAVPFLASAVRGLWEQREDYRLEAETLRAELTSRTTC